MHGGYMMIKYVFTPLLLLLFILTAQAEKISFCYDPWPPMHEDVGGKHQGLFVDIVKSLFGKMGFDKDEIIFEQLPWARCQVFVKDGSIDSMITVPTAERMEYAVASDQPVYQMNSSIYTSKKNPELLRIQRIKSIEEIKELGLTSVTYRGNGWYEKNIASKGVKTHYLGNIERVLEFIRRNRADVTIASIVTTNYMIKRLELTDELVKTVPLFEPLKFHLLVSEESSISNRIEEINIYIDEIIRSGLISELAEDYENF